MNTKPAETTTYPRTICETPDTWGPETFYIDAEKIDDEIESWEKAQGGDVEYDVDETKDWDLVDAEIGLYKLTRSRYDCYQLFAKSEQYGDGYWEIRSRPYAYGGGVNFAQFFGGSKGAAGYPVLLSVEGAKEQALEWLGENA